MVMRERLRLAAQALDSETPLLDARVLLSYVCGVRIPDLETRPLSAEEEEAFSALLARRKAGEPIAYLVGEKEFMGYPFTVTHDTLIPRPDTEALVEACIEQFRTAAPHILDLCTGSGCVGISLALFLPKARVTLSDVSDAALRVANRNIARHNLAARVETARLDVLHDDFPSGFDLITANPPYIARSVVETLEVARTEPRLALDGGAGGLDFYRAIAKKAAASLRQGGLLALEIGFDQGESVPHLLTPYFSDISVRKDYGGNDRVVLARA